MFDCDFTFCLTFHFTYNVKLYIICDNYTVRLPVSILQFHMEQLEALPDKAVLLGKDSTGCRPFSESSGHYKLSISVEGTGLAPQAKKNCPSRRAAMIHVDTFPTLPSALGLSLG